MSKKLSTGFGLMLFFLFALLTVAFFNFSRLSEADRLNDRSYRVLTALHDVETALAVADAEALAFALKGQAQRGLDLHHGKASLSAGLAALDELTSDNGLQQQRLARLKKQLQKWEREYLNLVIRAKPSGAEQSRSEHAVIIARRQSLVDALRSTLAEIHLAEDQALEERRNNSDALQSLTRQTLLIGGYFSVLLALLLWIQLTRSTKQLALANRELVSEVAERRRTADTLRESEQRLNEILASLSEAVWSVSPTGMYYLSPAAEVIYGRPMSDFAANNELWMEVMHPEDRARLKDQLPQPGQLTMLQSEYRIVRPNGEIRWVDHHSQAIRNEAGEIIRISRIVRDITERKEAQDALQKARVELELRVQERTRDLVRANQQLQVELRERHKADLALRESELQNQALLSAIPDMMFRFSSDGILLEIKESTGDITLANPDSTSQTKLDDALPTDLAQQIMKAAERARQSGRIETLEYRPATSGTARDYEARISQCGDSQYLSIVREISERKRAEEATRAAQQMLQLVMNHIPQAIFWKDRDSRFLGSNYRFARDAGYNSPQELIGKDDREMLWAEKATEYRADDLEVMTTGIPKLNAEASRRDADGTIIWLRYNKIPLHDENHNIVGVLGSYEDITAEKKAQTALYEAKQEAERASAAKSEFLSRMSHELRTPLNAILGFGQILELQELTPLQEESVGHILKGGGHLLGLINEILDLARVESGHIDLSPEAVCVQEVVRQSLDLVRPLAVQRKIQVQADAVSPRHEYVLADQQRLKQVLLNLLSNAVKYNEEGGTVHIFCTETAPETMRISVSDSGPGLDQQQIAKLFMPFERLEADKTAIEGTGLGLALSRRLIEAMQGNIGVESAVGKGSTFFIELPRAQNPMTQMELSENALPEHSGHSDSQYSVLSIEDNASNFRLIETVLHQYRNIILLRTTDGKSGIEMAQSHKPDLILLDLHLPDTTGHDVLRTLREVPATRDIPVVVLSADATKNQIERLMEAGACHYLTKPLNIRDFLQIIDETLPANERDN